MSKGNIEHKAIIKEVADNRLKVSIVATSACVSCSAKGICNVSEVEEKEVDIKHFEGDYRVGEEVKVFYREVLGFRALFLGYILPFLLILGSLIVGIAITGNEGLSGLIALASLAPYYIILFLTKKKINEKFAFSVKKI